MIRAAQGRAAVAGGQAGDAFDLEHALPQLALGLHVQRGREVVQHQQLGLAHEHARRGRALALPARDLHALRADQRLQAVIQVGQILLHHRQPHRAVQVNFVFRQAHQDVVFERLAEQQRDLRGIRAARRDEKCRRVFHKLPVPADFAGLFGQQAQQRAQQGGLARADPPGDDRERSAFERQVDIPHPARLVDGLRFLVAVFRWRAAVAARRVPAVDVGQPAHFQPVQVVLGGLGRVWDLRQRSGDVDRGVLHQTVRIRALQQGDHARQRHACLLEARDQHPQHGGEFSRVGQVEDKQREIAQRHLRAARAGGIQRVGGQQQDHAGDDVEEVPDGRFDKRNIHLIFHRGLSPRFVQARETIQHVRFRRRHFDRLRRSKHLADEVGHFSCRLAVGRAELLDVFHIPVGHQDHAHKRQVGEQRHPGADAPHGDHRDDGEQELPDAERNLHGEVVGVLHIVAEAADRLSRRLRHGLRPGPVKDAREHILAQQRARAEPEQEVQVNVGEDHHRLRQRKRHHDGRQRFRRKPVGFAAGQRVEELALDQARDLRGQPKDENAQEDQPAVLQRRIADQVPEVAPGVSRRFFFFDGIILRGSFHVTPVPLPYPPAAGAQSARTGRRPIARAARIRSPAHLRGLRYRRRAGRSPGGAPR